MWAMDDWREGLGVKNARWVTTKGRGGSIMGLREQKGTYILFMGRRDFHKNGGRYCVAAIEHSGLRESAVSKSLWVDKGNDIPCYRWQG